MLPPVDAGRENAGADSPTAAAARDGGAATPAATSAPNAAEPRSSALRDSSTGCAAEQRTGATRAAPQRAEQRPERPRTRATGADRPANDASIMVAECGRGMRR